MLQEDTEEKPPIVFKIAEPTNEGAEIHLIPARINYSGFANVSNFFTPSKSIEEGLFTFFVLLQYDSLTGEHVHTSSFRGVPLYGSDFKIPEGYQGNSILY